MTRNLLFACVLVSGAVLATGWALAPGCKGSFCLGSSFKTEADRDRARASEVPNAGGELLGGNTREPAPETASETWPSTDDTQASWNDTEPPVNSENGEQDEAAVAPEPEEASDDWQDQQTASTQHAARGESQIDAFEEDEEPQLSYKERKAQAAAAAKAAKDWESLAEAALGEPDDELRGAAINDVGLHRSAEAVVVLNEVAALDPSPDNRLQAIQQLWYSAADGLDSDGMIRSTLETALDDPDENIAAMAEQALADLQALEEAQEEAQQFN